MSERTNDDDEWVALLLAAAESPRMPDDVAQRLDRALRDELSGRTSPAGVPDGSGPATVGSGTDADADELHADDVDDPVQPLTADPDGDGPVPSVLGGASRPWGSSRRERREEHQGERRRRALARWAPVAAGVLLLGGAGVTAVAVLGQGGDDATAGAELEAATAVEDAPPAPRALVSTGTEYTTTDEEAFAAQVRSLVAVAGSGTDAAAAAEGGTAEVAEESAADSGAAASEPSLAADEAVPEASALVAPEAARAAVTDSPLVERTAFDTCVDEVTDGSASTVAAMDLAVVDGLESTVLVVPDATGANYLVYVVGPDCTGIDNAFKFFTVTP